MSDDLIQQTLNVLGVAPATTPPPPSTTDSPLVQEALGILGMTGNAPEPQGPLAQQEQKLHTLATKGPPAPAPDNRLIQQLQQITANPLTSDHETAMAALRAFQDAGIDGAMEVGDYVDDAVRQGNLAYGKLLVGTGLDKITGGETEQDKQSLRRAAIVGQLLGRVPLYYGNGAPLVAATAKAMVDQRVTQMYEQVRGSGGKGLEETQNFAAWAAVLKQLPDGAFWELYKHATYESQRTPVNSLEADMMKSEAPWFDKFMPGAPEASRALDTPVTTDAQLIRDQMAPDKFSIAGWRPFARPPGSPTEKLTADQLRGVWRQFFGTGSGMLAFYNEVNRQRSSYFQAKAGLVPSDDGQALVPGMVAKDLDFAKFAPVGAIERLLTRRMGAEPESRRTLTRIRLEQGDEAALAAEKSLVQAGSAWVAERSAELMQKPPPELPLTPTEAAMPAAKFAQAMAPILPDLIEGGTKIAADIDNAISSSRFVRETILQKVARGVGGEGAADVRNIGEAITSSLRFLALQGQGPGAFRERLREFGNVPGGAQLINELDQSFSDRTAEYFQLSNKKAEEETRLLGDLVGGRLPATPANVFEAFKSSLYLAGHSMTAGLVDQLATVADDPHTIAGFWAMGKGTNLVAKPLVGGASEMTRSLLNTWRLRNDLEGIFRYHPYKIKAFMDVVKDRVEQAVTLGRPNTVLNDALAALESFTKARATDGVEASPGEAASIMVRAWPELQDGLGQMGHLLGTKMIPRNALAQLARMAHVVTRPSKEVVSILGNENTTVPAIRALQDLTGARGLTEEMDRSLQNFREKNLRDPTPAEMTKMMPEGFHDLYGLMQAAENNNLQDPLFRRMYMKLFGKPAQDVALTAQSAEELMNKYISGALGLLDRTRAFGLPRDRANLFLEHSFRRMDVHAQHLELEVDALRRQENDPVARQTALDRESELFDLRRERDILKAAQDRLFTHNPEEAWSFPPEVREIMFKRRPGHTVFEDGVVTGQSVDMMMRLHPVLFEGLAPESLWDTVRQDLPPERVAKYDAESAALLENVRQLRRDHAAAKRNVIGNDHVLADWAGQIKDLQGQIEEIKKTPAETGHVVSESQILPEKVTEEHPLIRERRQAIADLEQRTLDRKAKLKAGTVVPDNVMNLRAQLDQAIRVDKMHREYVSRRKKAGQYVSQLNQDMFNRVVNLTRHDGLGLMERENLALARDQLAATAGQEIFGIPGNPFDVQWLPSARKSQLLHDYLHSSSWILHSVFLRTQEFSEALNKMSQKDRDTLGARQRAGQVPTELFERNPALEKFYKPGSTEANIDTFLREESNSFREFWRLLRANVRMPEHVVREFEKTDLDPRLYGITARPGLVTDKATRRAMRQEARIGGKPQIGALKQDWSELMFRREIGKFRVRVEEPSRVVDQIFDTREQMDTWLDHTYGRDALKDIGRMDRGVRRGRTIYGDDMTIGEPLTESELRIRDQVVGHTPEARVERLHRGLRDAYLSLLGESLNNFGGFVLSEEEHTKQVYGNKDLASKYVQVPGDPTTYGVLAGKFVHRRMLREMNKAARTYEVIDSMLRGWREMADPSEATGFLEALGKAPGNTSRFFRGLNTFAKSNVILKSIKTWFINWTFNIMSDHAAGTSVISAENFPTYLRRWFGRNPLDKLSDPLMQEARAHGVVGGFFEADSDAFHDLKLRIFDMEPKLRENVEALVKRRQRLVDELRAKKLNGDEPASFVAVEKDLFAAQSALDEANRTWLRDLPRKAAGAFLNLRTGVGQPANRMWAGVKRVYNNIDESFKLMQYAQLRLERGLPPEIAARVVRLFSQDYSNIPSFVRQIHPGIQSLVTSFPFEASRIITNMMMYRPTAAASLLLAMPFLNLMSFASAGFGWDRALGMIEARGKKGIIPASIALMTTLYLTDPQKRSITSEISIGNAMPFAGLLQSKGFLSKFFDQQVPPEQRGFWGQMAGLGLSYASNYVLNSPLFNAMAYTTEGVDPLTGEQLVDRDTPVGKRIWTVGKLVAADILPPQLPFGRDFEAFLRATDAPVSPKTGRPFKADEVVTAAIRGITGLTIRGQASEDIGRALGIGRRIADPTLVGEDNLIVSTTYKAAIQTPMATEVGKNPMARYGEANELRELVLRSIDPRFTPEERAKAEKDAEKLYKSMHETEVGAVRTSESMTDREFRLMVEKIKQDDPSAFFALQPIHVQAVTLANLDQQQLSDDRLRELIVHSKYASLGSLRVPRDPELVQRAIGYLDQRLEERSASPRLRDLRDHLQNFMLPMAKIRNMQDQLAEPIRQKRKDLLK